jgi:hypothetical protein
LERCAALTLFLANEIGMIEDAATRAEFLTYAHKYLDEYAEKLAAAEPDL